MDELRGPNIQIVLHVKEGLGFGFLRSPFVVSGSLNGYMLETDPVVPSHAPVFDAELVWEADKRRFRSLRVQNVPIKVEVFTTGTQGRKDKVGYLLLSLLGAQPCPSNKIVDIKHSWHRLLGIKSEGKCCHPQLMLSLSIEDRINTVTPRNELRLFHTNEIVNPVSATNPPTGRTMLLTLNEYMAESKKTVTTPELEPKLICDEGLIQIGSGRDLFILSFVIGAVDNLDMLITDDQTKEENCYVKYSVFTHTITTDRVCVSGGCAQFNQRSSLRVRSSLRELHEYFAQCPLVVGTVSFADRDIGVCSMDLRKLIPTENNEDFVNKFCNSDRALTIHERCFILRCDEQTKPENRRPYMDVEMSLSYVGVQNAQKPSNLTARSATQFDSSRNREPVDKDAILDYRSGSCTHLHPDVGGVAYTNMAACNTARYKTASGEAILQTNDIADIIKKMCDSFAESQEKLLAARTRPSTADEQVQCDGHTPRGGAHSPGGRGDSVRGHGDVTSGNGDVKSPPGGDVRRSPLADREVLSEHDTIPVKLEASKSDTCVCQTKREFVKLAINSGDREQIMQKFVEELEDWKEKQQILYKHQLKRKEEYHLEMLSKEWNKKRIELESKLSKGIEQCRQLAADLSAATDDFRLRGYRNTARERNLLDAKKALESHYTAKYQELREASQKMEDDMNHRLKLKDMTIEELHMKVQHLEKQVDCLKNNIKNCEKEAENKYSGLTKDQTASLIQELRCVEEKLDGAVQSKAFFKEQWGRAVRELHLMKLSSRKQMLSQLQHDRKQLEDIHDVIEDKDETPRNQPTIDIKKLKDDFYVDILANTPALETHSMISTSGPEGIDMYDDLKSAPKNLLSDKINELIAQRDSLIQQDNPDEELLKQLNHDIRNMLLNNFGS